MTQSPVLLLDLSLRCCGYAVVSFPFTFDDACKPSYFSRSWLLIIRIHPSFTY